MSISFIKDNAPLSIASGNSSGSVTIQAVTGTDLLVEITQADTARTVSGITANSGTITFARVGTRLTVGTAAIEIWRGKVTATGATSLTISFSGGNLSSTCRIRVIEVGGSNNTVADITATNTGTATSEVTGNVAPAAGKNGILFTCCRDASGTCNDLSSPWTALTDIGTAVESAAYQIITNASGANYNATFTSSGNVAFANFIVWLEEAGNVAPSASITSPANNSHYVSGSSIACVGTGTDPEDGTLTGASLVWTKDGSGTSLGTGANFTYTGLSDGTHTLTLTVTDSGGLTGTASITVTLGPAAVTFYTQPSTNQKSQVIWSTPPRIQLTTDGFTPDNQIKAYTLVLNTVSGTGTLIAGSSGNTNSSGYADLSTLKVRGNGTFNVTVSVTGYTDVISSNFTVSQITTEVLPSPPAHCCDQFGMYIPKSYQDNAGAIAYPLIFQGHGSSDEWSGANPGNKGNQYASTNFFLGLMNVILQICGYQTSYTPGWVEGDWEGIVVAPQYGNISFFGTLDRAGWTQTMSLLVPAIQSYLINTLGINIDTNRIYYVGSSGGAQCLLTTGYNDKRILGSRRVAGMMLQGLQTDLRAISQVDGINYSGLGGGGNGDLIYAIQNGLVPYLKDCPIMASAGQGDPSVMVDSSFSQASSTRALANNFLDPSLYGAETNRNYWYLEYDSATTQSNNTTGGVSHADSTFAPCLTTKGRDWLFAQRLVPTITPTWQQTIQITLPAVPHVSGDIGEIVTYIINIDSSADNLPHFKSVAAGGYMRSDGLDWAFYADAAHTQKLKADKISLNVTTGKGRFEVGLPANSGLNSGRNIYFSYGCASLNYDINQDGKLAFDHRVRKVIDFGDGASLVIQNLAPTLYPTRNSNEFSNGGLESFTSTGSPGFTTSPIGGAISVTNTPSNKYVTKNRNCWWGVKSGTNASGSGAENSTEATKALPCSIIVFYKPGTIAGLQTLAAIQLSTTANITLAVQQDVANAVSFQHGTVTVTHPTAASGSSYNFLAARLRTTTSRDIILNPASGVAGAFTNDTTSFDLVDSSGSAGANNYRSGNQLDIGYRNSNSVVSEVAQASIARIYETEFHDFSDDWYTAMDWMLRGKNVSYSIGSESSPPPPPPGGMQNDSIYYVRRSTGR